MSINKTFLPIFLFIGTIFAFIVSFVKPESDYSENNSTLNLETISSTQKKVDKSASNPQQLQKLSVLPLKCIGCGKCARIDSAHFEMSNDKAIVISSTNLNSSNLIMAINNCPVQAIVLE